MASPENPDVYLEAMEETECEGQKSCKAGNAAMDGVS